jgi:excisionase family DNA binding protein
MADYVSATEAASLLGRSESYIRKAIAKGDLKAEKSSGRWRIARHDLGEPSGTSDGTVGTPDGMNEASGGVYEADVTTGTSDEAREPLDGVSGTSDGRHDLSGSDVGTPGGTRNSLDATAGTPDGMVGMLDGTQGTHQWRDDLLAQVARLEANEDHWRTAMETSKARVIDLERELTVRDSRMVDLSEQVSILEAKVREVLEAGKDEAIQLAKSNAGLANRIADLVTAHEDMHARVVELQPVAEQVPMLQAAVEEKDASLSERDRELGNMRQDIEAIASRPVTGPVFRLLTKGKLRR